MDEFDEVDVSAGSELDRLTGEYADRPGQHIKPAGQHINATGQHISGAGALFRANRSWYIRTAIPEPPCRDSNPDHRPMACPRLGKVDRRLV